MPEPKVPQIQRTTAPVSGPDGVPSPHWRWGAYAVATLVLALVFALYVQPDMMVTLAAQLWACF
jgi:hypothetical protein